jgi:hypothetical protein
MEKPPSHENKYYNEALNKKRYNSSVASLFLTSGLFSFLRSNFFKKTPLRSPKTFIIKGLERSGTGFITNILSKNLFDTTIFDHKKHLFMESTADIPQLLLKDPEDYSDKIIILCVKNPYSWFLSYMDYWSRDTHTIRTLKKHKYFCEASHASGMIKMWNSFYNFYSTFSSQVFIIRYEDMLATPNKVISDLSRKFSIPKTKNFYNIKRYINNYSGKQMGENESFSRKEYFLSKKYLENMSFDVINDIEECLDKQLLEALGYSKEP